jgi:conjugative relaxase-like TrwC/TraI family protein
MLRITQADTAAGAVRYFENSLQIGDYYASGSVGRWHGLAAQRLGLSAEVTRTEFAALASNRLPNGDKLTVRDREDRRPGYDFCFSVPKSVSVYVAISEDPVVERLIDESVHAAMSRVEQSVEILDQTNGQHLHRVSGEMAYAQFRHTVTRPIDGYPDPHEHHHCWVPNASFDQTEGRWKAIEFGNLKKDAPFFEAVFHSELAERLMQNGYAVRRTDRDFELAGVPVQLIDRFSKRSKEIEKLAKAQHAELASRAAEVVKRTGMAFEDAYAQEKSRLGAKSRAAKTAEQIGPTERRAHWLSQMTLEERRALSTSAVKSPENQHVLSAAMAQDLTLDHAFERASVLRPLRMAAELLRRGIGRITRLQAEDFTKSDPRMVQVGNLVTTKQVVEEELAMLRLARDGKGRREPLGSGKEWTFQDSQVAGDEGQRNAVIHLLASRDLALSIRGKAGSGKSTMAREAVAAIEASSGKRVFLFAPSSGAVEVLRKDGLPGETFQLLHANGQMQKAVAGNVLWIDEASFLSAKDMRWVLQLAQDNGCRLVLAGDTKQHRGVQRGDALRVLEETGASVQVCLDKNYRQKNLKLRSAIDELSRGRTEQGFDKLDQFGVIREFKDPKERLTVIAERHIQAQAAGLSSLIVAPTHQECREIAETVRKSMRARGVLEQTDYSITRLQNLGLTDAQRMDAINYRPGVIVQFHKRVRGGFKTGEKWEVVGNDSRSILVQRDGMQRRFPLDRVSSFEVYHPEQLLVAIGDTVRITKNFKGYKNNALHKVTGISDRGLELDGRAIQGGMFHIDQGIAVTSHAAQGKTVDQVIVSAPVESFSQVSQEQLYVSMSRARHAMHLVTDNKAALRAAVIRTSQRLSPWELINAVEHERTVGISRAFNAIQRMTDLQESKSVAQKTQVALAERVAMQRQAPQDHEQGRGIER